MLKRTIGNFGEDEAVKFLKKEGYEIIERNFNTPMGEIDIIAKDNEYICFVEVRLRKSNNYGTPAETINYKKQQRIIKTAKAYIMMHNLFDKNFRFDVVQINAASKENGLKEVKIGVIKNAFSI